MMPPDNDNTPATAPTDPWAGIRVLGPAIGPQPSWAKAVIVAEYTEDVSDIQTDCFDARTRATVKLAWSRHTRDLFSEMRKAAAAFKPTAHLGTGKGLFRASVVLASPESLLSNGSAYYAGERSHWHGELTDNDWRGKEFSTRAEAESWMAAQPPPEPLQVGDALVMFAWKLEGGEDVIEHREKWSMGHGYYLAADGRYSTGWQVRKQPL
jgi:hypothetical protein